jgi:hypothetical protein
MSDEPPSASRSSELSLSLSLESSRDSRIASARDDRSSQASSYSTGSDDDAADFLDFLEYDDDEQLSYRRSSVARASGAASRRSGRRRSSVSAAQVSRRGSVQDSQRARLRKASLAHAMGRMSIAEEETLKSELSQAGLVASRSEHDEVEERIVRRASLLSSRALGGAAAPSAARGARRRSSVVRFSSAGSAAAALAAPMDDGIALAAAAAAQQQQDKARRRRSSVRRASVSAAARAEAAAAEMGALAPTRALLEQPPEAPAKPAAVPTLEALVAPPSAAVEVPLGAMAAAVAAAAAPAAAAAAAPAAAPEEGMTFQQAAYDQDREDAFEKEHQERQARLREHQRELHRQQQQQQQIQRQQEQKAEQQREIARQEAAAAKEKEAAARRAQRLAARVSAPPVYVTAEELRMRELEAMYPGLSAGATVWLPLGGRADACFAKGIVQGVGAAGHAIEILLADGKTTSCDAKELLIGSDGPPPSDVCSMRELNEATILNCVVERWRAKQPYTWLGSVLLSVNQFRSAPRPELVSPSMKHLYSAIDPSTSPPRGRRRRGAARSARTGPQRAESQRWSGPETRPARSGRGTPGPRTVRRTRRGS